MPHTEPIGFPDAGPVAQAFARRALTAGREVVLANSRASDTLTGLLDALGDGARAAMPAEVASCRW